VQQDGRRTANERDWPQSGVGCTERGAKSTALRDDPPMKAVSGEALAVPVLMLPLSER